jgi:hypothetical protein
MTLPRTRLALRFAQDQPRDGLFEIEPAVRTFDPNTLAYLETASVARVFTLVQRATDEPADRVAWWCARRHTAMMAMLVLLQASDAPLSRPRMIHIDGKPVGGVRQRYAMLGGPPALFGHNATHAGFDDFQREFWQYAEAEPAPTVAELLAEARVTGDMISYDRLRAATGLVGLLDHVAATAAVAARRLIGDAIRRGLITGAGLPAQVKPRQLVTLHVLGGTCVEVDDGLMWVALTPGAGVADRVAIFSDGSIG